MKRRNLHSVRRTSRSPLTMIALPLALLASACDPGTSSPLAPDTVTDIAPLSGTSSSPLTLTELTDLVGTGAQRVEVNLESSQSPLAAREVEVEGANDLNDEEEIESSITALTVTNGAGTLTLDLGELEIEFDNASRLRGPDGRSVTVEELADIVDAMLATGGTPPVEVRRPAPAEPQAPDDASFFATEVRLDRNLDAPKLELNIDNDNLTLPQAAPPDAILHVLGLDIEITVGVTEIEKQEAGQDDDDDDQDDGQDDDDGDDDDQADAVEFEDTVVSADASGGRFTLEDGNIVSIDANTVVDPDGDLTTLADVEAALAAGRAVRAEGDGALVAPGPPDRDRGQQSEVRSRPRRRRRGRRRGRQ